MDLKVIPYPQQCELGTGSLQVIKPLLIDVPHPLPTYHVIAAELDAKFTDASGLVRFLQAEEAAEPWQQWASKAEGYALEIHGGGIDIWASHPAGHLYGAMTLKQLMKQYGTNLPYLRISDWPTMPHRGIQIALAQGYVGVRMDYLKELVSILARWKINALYLYIETYFQFPSIPNIGGPEAMTADEARELDRLCQAYQIQLIPQLNLLGHNGDLLSLQKFQHLAECPPDKDHRSNRSATLCPCSDEVKQLLTAILEDTLDIFSSNIIHVGGDEVGGLGSCKACNQIVEQIGKIGLYVNHFQWIKQKVNSHGRKIGLWGDMILHHVGEDSQKWRDLEELRDGTIIYDWHYRSGGALDTLQAFADAGFQTVASASTNLCYSSAMSPAESVKHQTLYRDAITTNAYGGLTTAWINAYGLHEEHFNYLYAVDGWLMWTGADRADFASESFMNPFDSAYCLQRYGLESDDVAKYLHAVGDESGPVLAPLSPHNGINLRKCLYHTDNVLMMWRHYNDVLAGNKLSNYADGIKQARLLWDKIETQIPVSGDPYLHLLVGPLLTHEHLLRRFEMTEDVYQYYDAAAHAQDHEPVKFKENLAKAADILLSHLDDFAVVEAYLQEVNALLGLESGSLYRLQMTKHHMQELASFFLYLAESRRALPTFIQLSYTFMQPSITNWANSRQHEWESGSDRFKRYSVQTEPWPRNPW